MKKLLLALFLCLFSVCSWAANGDIKAVSIDASGWSASITVEGVAAGGTYDFGLGANNDPTNAKIKFTVVSLGYDNAGSATTITRTVYGTKQLRQAYPNEASNDETVSGSDVVIRVALSDYIYQKDNTGAGNSGTAPVVAVSAGWYTDTAAEPDVASAACTTVTCPAITNNSTVAYPKVIGHFAIEQRRPVNSTQEVEVFAVHKYAQNDKPVAAVVITATGATSAHTETATVTSMTLSSRGDNIPVYAVSLNLSVGAGFTRGELININFTAYPWVGDSAAVLDANADAGANPWQLGLLKWTIMDKMIAVVDPTNGNDTTCVASADQATADAAACQTISGALTKIQAANNSAYSLSRVDGGEIQLYAGTYKMGKYSTQTVTNGYFTVCPHATTNRAGVVFDGYVTDQNAYTYTRYYNITINRPSNIVLVFGSNKALVMEKVSLIDTATGWYSGSTGDVEFLDCVSTSSYLSKGGNDGHSRLNRNSTFTSPVGNQLLVGDASCVLGLKLTGGNGGNIWVHLTSTNETNIIIAYSKLLSLSAQYFILGGGASGTITNMAIVNNLVERYGASATPLSEISNAAISNLLLLHNTFVGQRFTHENDIVAPFVNVAFTDYTARNNLFNARGDHRADVYDDDGTMTGTWAVNYSVGWSSNWNEAITYSGDDDFWGLYSNIDTGSDSGTAIVPSAPVGYLNDKSGSGGAGGGDYHLTSASMGVYLLPAGGSVMPFDLDGKRRRPEGGDDSGAYTRGLPKIF